MMRLVSLREKEETGGLHLHEHVLRKDHASTRANGGHLQARKSVLTKNQICQYLDIRLPSLQNYEK